MSQPGPIPWVPGAIRQLLLADAPFMTECGSRLSSRLPSTVTFCARVRLAGNNSLSGDGVAWSPLIQVEGWCAPGVTGVSDPEVKAWDIAARAAVVIGRSRNITYQNMTYSVRLVEGPLSDVDTSRGESTPLYWSLVRAELNAHVTAT